MKYVKIVLDDNLGGGSDYQFNCLYHEAKKIGLKAELVHNTKYGDKNDY